MAIKPTRHLRRVVDTRRASSLTHAVILGEDGSVPWDVDGEVPSVTEVTVTGDTLMCGSVALGSVRELVAARRLCSVSAHAVEASAAWRSGGGSDLALDAARRAMRVPNCKKMVDGVLDFVRRHVDHLTKPENLDQLAYVMMRWDSLYKACSLLYGLDGKLVKGQGLYPQWSEVKYVMNDERDDLLYDAWYAVYDHTVRRLPASSRPTADYHELAYLDEEDFRAMLHYVPSDIELLGRRRDLTMDEWEAVLTHPRYTFSSLFRTPDDVRRRFFFSSSSEMGWNERGYLCRVCENGTDLADFGEFQTGVLRMPPAMRDELCLLLGQEDVQRVQSAAKRCAEATFWRRLGKERAKLARSGVRVTGDFERPYELMFALEEAEARHYEELKSAAESPLSASMLKLIADIRAEFSVTIPESVAAAVVRRKSEEPPRAPFSFNPKSPVEMPHNAHHSYVDAYLECLRRNIEVLGEEAWPSYEPLVRKLEGMSKKHLAK